ncbi:hypothetical protein OVN18_09835 [Microcella daejeonensis]|uniref:Uncharacterized protein n=1 Tax=Microcella daejeonensis TaxID=2994971 RepID=A0A9E8MJS5_9MICO|nr:hypothetical protein [Microcella daejeonensis]WAB80860.1 hypothetical protein OVN18_09835 [Microcella daejeonensis]
MSEALGGRWATHPVVWLLMLPAASMLVVLQELEPGTPTPAWVLLSALAQHLVDGAVVVGGGALIRRRHPVLPVPVIAGLWLLAAIGRSVTGAAVAVAAGGRDPELLFRLLSWSLTSAAWVPVTVYAIAVIMKRRATLGELDVIEQRLRALRDRELRTSETTRAYLVSSLSETVVPVLDALQTTLAATRHSMSGAAAAEMSLRISQVHDRVLTVVDSVGSLPEHEEAVAPRPPRLSRVVDLRPDRPWSTALLIGLSTLALLLPPAAAAYGAPSTIELLVATAAAVLALGAIPAALERWPIPGVPAYMATLAGGVVSVVIALLVMLTSGIDSITSNGLQLAPLLAFSLGGGNVMIRSAIAVSNANDAAESVRAYRGRELEALEVRYLAVVAQERERLAQIMHGPVQGRLAACVMALNFHAGPDAEPGEVAAIAERVLDHLSAASSDLGMLISRPASSGSSVSAPEV